MPNVLTCLWRLGSPWGHVIYAVVHGEPSEDDIPLGFIEDNLVAEQIVNAHNATVVAA